MEQVGCMMELEHYTTEVEHYKMELEHYRMELVDCTMELVGCKKELEHYKMELVHYMTELEQEHYMMGKVLHIPHWVHYSLKNPHPTLTLEYRQS